MEKTIKLLLYMSVISGLIFTSCGGNEGLFGPDAEDPNPVVEDEVLTEMPVGDEDVDETVVEEDDEGEDEPEVTVTTYADGEYTQTGNYESPAGPESVTVKVTLNGDVIEGLEVTSNATHDISQRMQGLFIEGINEAVVGKNLGEIGELGQVNGSSLTPGGFAQALEAVKAEALNG